MPRVENYEIESAIDRLLDLIGSTDARHYGPLNDVLGELKEQISKASHQIEITIEQWKIERGESIINQAKNRLAELTSGEGTDGGSNPLA